MENTEVATSETAPMPLNVSFVIADHIVSKNYQKTLTALPLVTKQEQLVPTKTLKNGQWIEGKRKMVASDQARFFKLEKIVYDRKENNLQKLTNLYSAASAAGIDVAMIIHSDGKETAVYIGVIERENRSRLQPKAEAIQNYFSGNFQGSNIVELDNEKLDDLMRKCLPADDDTVVSVSGVPSIRSAEYEDNDTFYQGMEKLLDAMHGEPFSAIFVANAVSNDRIQDIRAEYEMLYSALVPFAKSTVTFSDSNSDSITKTLSDSLSDTVGSNTSSSLSLGVTKGTAHTAGSATTNTDTSSINRGKNSGFSLGPFSFGKNVGSSYSHSKSRTESVADTISFAKTKTKTTTTGTSNAHTVTKTTSDGTTETYTYGKSLQLSYENKSVTTLLERIDAQLERVKASESFGLFAVSSYFTAPDRTLAVRAASAYKSIVSGTNTGLESSAINIWEDRDSLTKIREYLTLLYHPVFLLSKEQTVSAATMVSAQELALQMGLPKKSVPGVTVVETAAFGRNIHSSNLQTMYRNAYLDLGNIYHMGREETGNPAKLNINSLAMHTFVTGSTGSGKSNTVYQMLHEISKKGRKFLVVEPAKGEYKNIFGNDPDVHVYGTNPQLTKLLRINPFSFPEQTHIYEHMDRLIEIFNVCWPMYAAMPAVLKDAIERAYIDAGWNLKTSVNRYNCRIFPTFADVLWQIDAVMEDSQYSANSKGDYKGALSTRLKSLTNGINGMVFTADELPAEALFDENVIVDLSRVGSTETKSLIMGLLVMKLQEHRMAQAAMNSELKHVTVLEEAHNLLKRTSTEQSAEGSNLLGKSVEMITNAIAEMRTYGEGFIIVDQAPGLLDMAAIRNTNTKIILRLPEYSDRELTGRACGLTDDQIEELAKFEKGVAAVYQNDWTEAVLCKVNHYACKEELFAQPDDYTDRTEEAESILLSAVACGKLQDKIARLEEILPKTNFSAKLKCSIMEFKCKENPNFSDLAKIAYDFFQPEQLLQKLSKNASDGKDFLINNLEPAIDGLNAREQEIILLMLSEEHIRRTPGDSKQLRVALRREQKV